MFEKKFGLGLMGAAALAACSPEKGAGDSASPESAVLIEDEQGDKVITIPDETAPEERARPQYTEEQIDKILSGTTGEVDSMSPRELRDLGESAQE